MGSRRRLQRLIVRMKIATINYHQRGFSILELVFVITIISLLFSIAVDKLLTLRIEAERVAMNQILGSLRSAMSIQIASHISKGTVNKLAESAHGNPMDWLSEKPDNYLGVLDEPDPADISPGKWYFDSYNNFLVYRVSSSDHFSSPLKGPKRARFQVTLDYSDINENGVFNADIDKIHGLSLKSIEQYQWLTEEINLKDFASSADTNTRN